MTKCGSSLIMERFEDQCWPALCDGRSRRQNLSGHWQARGWRALTARKMFAGAEVAHVCGSQRRLGG